jgi:group I intron endonuclease
MSLSRKQKETDEISHLFSYPYKSAIYGILNLINGKIYIGSAVNVYHRLHTHKSKLKYGNHGNKHLQSAWREYGELAFEFIVLEYVLWKSDLIDREQIWIDLTDCHNPECGYNFRKAAHSNLGLKKPPVSDETRLKLSIANTGRKLTEERKKKISEFHTGRKHTEEQKANAVKGREGYRHSDDTAAKIGASNSLPDKWPHADKSACKCRECKDKRNLANHLNRYNRVGKYAL